MIRIFLISTEYDAGLTFLRSVRKVTLAKDTKINTQQVDVQIDKASSITFDLLSIKNDEPKVDLDFLFYTGHQSIRRLKLFIQDELRKNPDCLFGMIALVSDTKLDDDTANANFIHVADGEFLKYEGLPVSANLSIRHARDFILNWEIIMPNVSVHRGVAIYHKQGKQRLTLAEIRFRLGIKDDDSVHIANCNPDNEQGVLSYLKLFIRNAPNLSGKSKLNSFFQNL